MDSEIKIPKKKRNRKLRRALILLVLLTIFSFISVFVIGFLNKDHIKQIVLKEINKNLLSEATFDDFNFSLLKRFPLASIEFTGVKAKEITKSKTKENLVEAESIFLHFNVVNMLRKNYVIKKLELTNARLNIKIFRDKTDNYHIWKKQEKDDKSSFSFDLQKIILKEVQITFSNEANNFFLDVIADKSTAKGKFSEVMYNLSVNGDYLINQIRIKKMNYLNNQEANVNLDLAVDGETRKYDIKNGKLSFNNALFDVAGFVIDNENEKKLDLIVQGLDLELQELLDELPSKFKDKLIDYQANGEIDIKLMIKGSYFNNNDPYVRMNFKLRNGSVRNKSAKITFHNLNLIGEFSIPSISSPESFHLLIREFNGLLESGTIAGRLEIKDFISHKLNFSSSVSMNLEEIQRFFQIENIETISGMLDGEFRYKGNIEDFNNLQPKDFIRSSLLGKLEISEMDIKLKDNENQYFDVDAEMRFYNNEIEYENISGKFGKSEFSINGTFRNFLSFLFIPEENLYVDARFKSQELDVKELIYDNSKKK